MIMVIMNWLYIGITSFLLGYAVLSLFARLFSYHIKHPVSVFLAGLAAATVYAQVYSLFSGVSLTANILLVIFCALIAVFLRKGICSFLRDITNGESKTLVKRGIALAVLFFLFAYGTSRGYLHFDTGLYHAQSIRWIEEYGVVPGLANLQARFGYNSAAFSLTALYSMKFLLGQSLHTTAGFFAFLSSWLALDLYQVFTGKRILLSDFVRIGLVFYLGIIFSQMVSPASDYYAQLLIFDILILWLSQDERRKEEEKTAASYAPYAVLCILLVYAATIKFSIAPLLLLVLKPAVMMIRQKDVKNIVICILAGVLILLPFFIRNVIISGWLVYPSAAIDLFDVDWKIPKGQVQYDAMEIGVYGKGINDVTKKDMPITEWLPNWFDGLKSLEKVWVLLTVAALIMGMLYLMMMWLKKSGKTREVADFALVFGVLSVSSFFWFFSAPLIRYGYVYVTAIPLVTFGYFYGVLLKRVKREQYKKTLHGCILAALTLFLLVRCKGLAADIKNTWQQDYYVRQEDYYTGETDSYTIGGITIYVPLENGQIGYDKFPSSPTVLDIELRGNSIEDGFRQNT